MAGPSTILTSATAESGISVRPWTAWPGDAECPSLPVASASVPKPPPGGVPIVGRFIALPVEVMEPPAAPPAVPLLGDADDMPPELMSNRRMLSSSSRAERT